MMMTLHYACTHAFNQTARPPARPLASPRFLSSVAPSRLGVRTAPNSERMPNKRRKTNTHTHIDNENETKATFSGCRLLSIKSHTTRTSDCRQLPFIDVISLPRGGTRSFRIPTRCYMRSRGGRLRHITDNWTARKSLMHACTEWYLNVL